MAENGKSAEELSATKDHVALELMKFIANTTGYGTKATAGVGFSGKGQKSPEEQADLLLDLFQKCRSIVKKD